MSIAQMDPIQLNLFVGTCCGRSMRETLVLPDISSGGEPACVCSVCGNVQLGLGRDFFIIKYEYQDCAFAEQVSGDWR